MSRNDWVKSPIWFRTVRVDRRLVTSWQQLSALPLRANVLLGRRFRADERDRGASLVEYALLVAFIAIVCIAAVTLLGTSVEPQYSSIADGLD